MAIEQNEIKKVITVDLGNTATSLKEYKKHIDDLKGSLLQLDETSEEYQKIAQEVKNEQDKLNEVMKVGKTSTDAAEGSYDKLAKTMAELKKQWKATGDEAERTELGKQILDINNQLKELDASTGNYQRNVGDYANAFEQAFDKCLDGIQSIDGPLGTIGGTVKQMLPVIKSINSTALTGLSGIKKAIASTGIGLLVVAVGTLAANWDKVADAIDNATNKNSIYTKQLNETIAKIEEINRKYKEGNQSLTDQIKLMASLGATKLEQLKTSKEAAERDKANFEEEFRQNETVIEQLKEKRASIIEANRAASYGSTGGGLGADTSAIDKQINALEERNKVLKEGDNDAIEGIDKITQRLHNLTIDIEAETNTQIRIIENSLKSEEQKLTETYESNKKLLEEQGKDTTALTEKFLKDLAALNDKGSKAITDAKKNSTKDEQEEVEKQATTILDTLHKNTTDQLTLFRERYEQELDLLQKAGKDTTSYTQWFENEVARITQEATDKAVDKEIEEYFNRRDREAEQLQFENELSKQKTTNKSDELDENERIAQREYEIAQQVLQDKIDFLSVELEEYEGTAEAKLALEEELDQYKQQYANNDKKRAKETAEYKAEKEEEAAQNAKKAWQSASSSIASIFGSLADLMEEGSEEAKAFSIMQTILNTLQSIMGIWAGYSEMGPFGVAAAAVQTAAVTAMGAATIAKMKSTTKDSSSSASVAAPQISTPSMTSVNPLLDEQSDLNRLETSNIQGNSSNEPLNMRVYVVDQDIRDANQKAEVVENNATF